MNLLNKLPSIIDTCQFSNYRCIDIDSTTAPTKLCFCAMGYFGKMCEKKSVINQPVILGQVFL